MLKRYEKKDFVFSKLRFLLPDDILDVIVRYMTLLDY